jgi:hypothetical protein
LSSLTLSISDPNNFKWISKGRKSLPPDSPCAGDLKQSSGGFTKARPMLLKKRKPLHSKPKKQSIWEFEFTGKAGELDA